MVWIVGDKGMLGSELKNALMARGIEFIASDRDVDILNPSALEEYVSGRSLRWVINCAAYTAVDKAEDEEAIARRLNAEGPENLARLAAKRGARLLHISTDYVFAGNAQRPYLEGDAIGPTGAYGRTKAEGERLLMAASSDSVIVRTAWLYGRNGPNFVATMLKLMAERDTIGVVADQRGTPTWAADLALALTSIIERKQMPAGIYHYTNEGETTWYDFAREIHRLGRLTGLLQRDCTINPLTTAQYPTKASRPAYSVLSKEKIKALGIPLTPWQTSLERYLKRDLIKD